MITKDTTIKIGIPLGGIVSILTVGFYWAAENLATKSDIEQLQMHNQYADIELQIQIAEIQIIPLENNPNPTASEKRQYEQIKKRIERLLVKREEIIE